MSNTRLILGIFLGLALAQSASANTVWLKVPNGGVCKNNNNVIGLGEVDRSGTFTMTINNPSGGTITPSRSVCSNLPVTTTPLVFSGNIPAQVKSLHNIGPGTKGNSECLVQGDNLFYLDGSVTLASGPYTLTLSFTPGTYSDGCDPSTGAALTPNGQPKVIRTATLTKPSGTPFNGSYYLFNAAAIPEPDTLYLLGAGALAVLLLRRKTRRAAG